MSDFTPPCQGWPQGQGLATNGHPWPAMPGQLGGQGGSAKHGHPSKSQAAMLCIGRMLLALYGTYGTIHSQAVCNPLLLSVAGFSSAGCYVFQLLQGTCTLFTRSVLQACQRHLQPLAHIILACWGSTTHLPWPPLKSCGTPCMHDWPQCARQLLASKHVHVQVWCCRLLDADLLPEARFTLLCCCCGCNTATLQG